MENNETILVKRKGYVGIIELNRPKQLNAFTTALAQDLNKTLKEAEKNTEIRVVVIKGKGKAFSAGIDVTELEGKTTPEISHWVKIMGEMSLTIAKMKKPVIVSVQDLAIANGIGLVAAADLAIAAEGARFGATAVNVGLFCMGPAVPLSRHLSKKKTLELILTGDLIDAAEAEKIGLLNKVVPGEKLEEETMKLAQKIAQKSPLAVQSGKSSFYETMDMPYEKALEAAGSHFALLCLTEDAREGIDAFLNKRTPRWKGK